MRQLLGTTRIGSWILSGDRYTTVTEVSWRTVSVRSASVMTATYRYTTTQDGTSPRSMSGLPHLQKAMKYVRGRTLDIGCGAGRVTLPLQQRGVDVVGIDNSPLAVRICRERGVNDVRLISVTRVSAKKLGHVRQHINDG